MAGRIKDISGERFGRLVAVERLEEKHPKHGYKWLCECDCGNKKEINLSYLTSGHTTSCGCLRDEINSTPNSYEDVIERFNKKHNGKYIYPEYNKELYVNQLSRIDVICPKHGKFTRKVHNHLRGGDCHECRTQELIDEGVYLGTYSDEFFENNPDMADVNGIVYYFKIGDLYKIGITRVSIEKRTYKIKCDSQLEVEILDFKEMPLNEAYKLEKEILSRYKENRVYTEWSTELFDYDVLNGKIKKL
ncbi:GIY-YIG nuclease family protein [Peribacillus asahii]|uniref:GIY-YIG nuclease family protein n=1 Tax=Peribacillus asahii TaxID=228899 RepID=UPI00207AEA90|nr:GIY-YIG nuclease family protein [Peribacillus asahii]USK62351.1 hypothetical protein LIT37_22910 [Peribacillus asahii]